MVDPSARARSRQEPPPFRPVSVLRIRRPNPRVACVTLAGSGLAGFDLAHPAASLRLLLPADGESGVPIVRWDGNQFLQPDGTRPTIRTLTPRRLDTIALELDVEIVIHGAGAGAASAWAATVRPGHSAAVSGPGRGYAVDAEAPAFFLAGDETALPAMCQLLEVLPDQTPVEVHVEAADPEARRPLPDHRQATVRWHDLGSGEAPGTSLISAVGSAELCAGTRIWAAGEAAAMQRLRRHLFEERELPRSQATVRGYWKRGRHADADVEG